MTDTHCQEKGDYELMKKTEKMYTYKIPLLKVFSHGELILCWSSPLDDKIKWTVKLEN